ncbi:MAG: B12-binding domain-containing radical SAM protein [Deltaproteobacteria bacterium]|nr:B12-binding domain-containing radical SAM protein [Deltaproteobacteria bacterium]
MKILLVSSNCYSQFPGVFPNGVGALSAYLKQKGHDVHSIHYYKKSDIRGIGARLREVNPDVVGISILSCELPIVEPTAAAVKQWKPEIPVIVGGIHAIVDPENTVRLKNIDAVCAGEGELAFTEYLERLEKGEDVVSTPNFAFLIDGKMVLNDHLQFIKDLNSLPRFDRTVADLQRIIDANNGVINLLFGRGCPWHCKFCGNEYIRRRGSGTYSRMVDVQTAMQELAQLEKNYDFEEICIRDDTFSWNRKWAAEFLEEYSRRFRYPIHVFSRPDTLDDDMIAGLAKAGCVNIFIGLDSGNDYIRNEVLNKKQSNDELFRVTGLIRDAGMIPVISNIVGLPFETPEMFQETVEVNKRLHEDKVVFSAAFGATPKIWVFTPWPGTDLYNLSVEKGWLKTFKDPVKVYRESMLEMPQFPQREIERRFRTFRYHVYKDRFPMMAALFLVFDSKWFQAVYERIPMETMGKLRKNILNIYRLFGRKGKKARMDLPASN